MPLSKIQGINGQVTPNLGRRNLVINGDMQVAQRGTSSSSLGYQTVDRFSHNADRQQFVATQEQSTDVPTGKGYTRSYKITTTTPETTIDGNNYNTVRYIFEAQDLQHLCWGTSAAKSLSVSFWVKSSVTGTYVTSNYFYDPNRNITVPYTISSANTWEYKTIVIPGDTGGTINNDNGAGLAIQFVLSAGPNYQGTVSTSWGSYVDARWGNGQTAQMMNVNGSTWAITGLQVEVGDTATEFEHRSFDEELILCQRYYQKSYVYETAPGTATQHGSWSTGGHQGGTSTAYVEGVINFERLMRTTPTVTLYDHDGNSNKCARLSTGVARYQNQSISTSQLNARGVTMYSTTGTAAGIVQGHYTVSAEL